MMIAFSQCVLKTLTHQLSFQSPFLLMHSYKMHEQTDAHSLCQYSVTFQGAIWRVAEDKDGLGKLTSTCHLVSLPFSFCPSNTHTHKHTQISYLSWMSQQTKWHFQFLICFSKLLSSLLAWHERVQLIVSLFLCVCFWLGKCWWVQG